MRGKQRKSVVVSDAINFLRIFINIGYIYLHNLSSV